MHAASPTLSPIFNPNAAGKWLSPAQPGAHIAVFGAGAFGGWTALMLLEKGFKVTLVDPWGAGNSRSSSGGESRLIRMVYGDNDLYTQLAMRSYDLWEKYQQALGRQLLFPTGNLWFCATGDTTIESAVELLKRHQLPHQVLSPKEAKQRFPEVNVADLGFVLHEQKTGFLLAREATQAVCAYFVNSGGTFLQDNLDFRPLLVEGKAVLLSDGTVLQADNYIFACGPWLPHIFPDWLGKDLTVTRQEIYYFGTPASDASAFAQLPSWIDHASPAHYYGVPNTAFRGFKLASDTRGETFDPTNDSREPSLAGIRKAADYLAHRFPKLKNMPLLESRVCQYTNTVDGNFVFDSHPQWQNVFALGAGSGHGFKHGPAVGELVSDVISGKQAIPAAWLVK